MLLTYVHTCWTRCRLFELYDFCFNLVSMTLLCVVELLLATLHCSRFLQVLASSIVHQLYQWFEFILFLHLLHLLLHDMVFILIYFMRASCFEFRCSPYCRYRRYRRLFWFIWNFFFSWLKMYLYKSQTFRRFLPFISSILHFP